MDMEYDMVGKWMEMELHVGILGECSLRGKEEMAGVNAQNTQVRQGGNGGWMM